MFFLKLLFHDEGHLYASCLFYIPTICPKWYLFQFFSRGIRMYIPILTGAQNGRTSLQKNQSYFSKKRSSRGFISEMKITFILNFSLIFRLFILNAIFLSSLVVA